MNVYGEWVDDAGRGKIEVLGREKLSQCHLVQKQNQRYTV